MYETQPQHEMKLIGTHPSGVEEWLCPTCGRRFLMKWPPAYKKVVLEPGDLNVIHSGGKGGVHMGPPQVTQVEDDEISEESLSPWLEALEDIDFDAWWDDEAA
ncbi:MAG: hypothetical protein M5U01_40245 [Ardenticatenaceae bacterium]|nr:hypothetical protein [Ardenticatenaceae bacterium]